MATEATREEPKIRCLLGMLGTDIHSKGIRALALLLRDSGLEVIYIGEHNSVAGMAQAVIDEDADIVGVSFSSGAYLEYMRQLIDGMKQAGVGDVPVMIGGIIHPDDRPILHAMGVQGIFGAGSSIPEIVAYVRSAARPRG